MKISVLPSQEIYLSSRNELKQALKLANVLGFDIYCGRTLIGFILVRKYLDNAFFLWDYAIDHKYQNSGYGFTALCKFISFMQKGYNMNTMTTTYIYGNKHPKHIYEKIGFLQTNVVNKEDCYEVNMILHKRAPV